MAEDTLAARIDRIESRSAISDLIHAYARAVRYDRPEDVPALFAPGGWFEIRDGHPSRPEFTIRSRMDTPEALGKYLMLGKGKPHPVPLLHNIMIDLDGDEASATSVMEGQVFGTEHKVFGEYRDRFRRVDGQWLFASRTFTIFSTASSV
ncbi:MAG: nuclear transport factor 2 family protein [Novosphingobium sp.]|nr:nuclear transport factor 2 family protein [Novosphingobium sp.]